MISSRRLGLVLVCLPFWLAATPARAVGAQPTAQRRLRGSVRQPGYTRWLVPGGVRARSIADLGGRCCPRRNKERSHCQPNPERRCVDRDRDAGARPQLPALRLDQNTGCRAHSGVERRGRKLCLWGTWQHTPALVGTHDWTYDSDGVQLGTDGYHNHLRTTRLLGWCHHRRRVVRRSSGHRDSGHRSASALEDPGTDL